MVVPFVVAGRDHGYRGPHRAQKLIGDVIAAMMARFGHIALKLDAAAGVVVEQCPLAAGVEVTGQENARALVVQAHQQAVAVRVLARRRAVIVQRRLSVELRLEGGEQPDGDTAVAPVEAGKMIIDLAQSMDRRCRAVQSLGLGHVPHEVGPLALEFRVRVVLECRRDLRPLFHQLGQEFFVRRGWAEPALPRG